MLRQKLGLTQVGLAKKLGFHSHVAISRFEQGKSIPSGEILIKLASLADIDLHKLLTGEASLAKTKQIREYRDSVVRLLPFIDGYMTWLHKQKEVLQEEMGQLEALHNKGSAINLNKLKELKADYERLEQLYTDVISNLHVIFEVLDIKIESC